MTVINGTDYLPPVTAGAFDPDCARAGRAHKWLAVWDPPSGQPGATWQPLRRCGTCGHVERMPTASEIAKGEA